MKPQRSSQLFSINDSALLSRPAGCRPLVAPSTTPVSSFSMPQAVSCKLSAVVVVSTKDTIRCRPFGQSAIYNLQSEMPRCSALPPASNRVTDGPPSAYGSRLTGPIPAMDDGRTVGRGPQRPRTMRCQTGAAGANDPRRVNNHLLSPEFSRAQRLSHFGGLFAAPERLFPAPAR
jgi:hypothetical protein